jgi:outer membrane protein assembly factor BamB
VSGSEIRWQFATEGAIYSSPIISVSGTIYFGSQDGHIYALNRRGELEWKLNLRGEVRSSPALGADGSLYAATVNGRIFRVTP